LPAKTIFATPVFSMEKPVISAFWQKPANPGGGGGGGGERRRFRGLL